MTERGAGNDLFPDLGNGYTGVSTSLNDKLMICVFSRGTLHFNFKSLVLESLLWLSGNETNQYPRGCRFNHWPHSVG